MYEIYEDVAGKMMYWDTFAALSAEVAKNLCSHIFSIPLDKLHAVEVS